MDLTFFETGQVLLAIAIMIVAFGLGRYLDRLYH